MAIDKPLVIDLKKYGKEGIIEMQYPTFRKQKKFESLCTKMLTSMNGTEAKVQSDNAVDAMLLNDLAFVETAPFDITIEGFYNFTDELDLIKRGNGDKLYTEMQECIEKIKIGDTSPSPVSLAAETETTE